MESVLQNRWHQSLFSLFHQGNKTTFHENIMERFHQIFDRSYVRYLANDLRLSKAEKVSCYVFLVTRGQGLSFYTHAMLCIQDDKQSN